MMGSDRSAERPLPGFGVDLDFLGGSPMSFFVVAKEVN